MTSKEIECRVKAISSTKRILLKVGTRLLTDESQIPHLMFQIHKLRQCGYEVILVSSGAVGLGLKTIGLSKRPHQLSKKQALASVGQGRLMRVYEDAAAKYGFCVGQLLLSRPGLEDRECSLNMLNCINELLAYNVLPIINENDSVSIEELTFGDNDTLGALVASITQCKLMIILTTVDGLYNVENGKFTNRISLVEALTEDIISLAGGTDDANNSIGGMASKLRAAEIAASSGNYLWIISGKELANLEKAMNGDEIGTLFVPPEKRKLTHKKCWLSFFTRTRGKILLDKGASEAVSLSGKSILPSGIKSIDGDFKRGDAVEIISNDNTIIAKGLVNYKASELKKIIGLQTHFIQQVLGYQGDDEVVHRDNLVLSKIKY